LPAADGAGWMLFAGIMMALISVLNIIYRIAAIGDSHFFVNDQSYILSGLSTWGWVTLGIGAIQSSTGWPPTAGGAR
jgi:hypothetical protein